MTNSYQSQCISFFMGESDKQVIAKFTTFEFSTTLETIFRFCAIVNKFLQDEVFCNELNTLFNNFYTFCQNHNEFTRQNENVMITILESFSCTMTLMKHKKIYQYFVKLYEGRQFFQELVLNLLLCMNSLNKTAIQSQKSFYLLKNCLTSLNRHQQYNKLFENFTNFEFNKLSMKESMFFFNKFQLDKTISSNVQCEWYDASLILFDCISCYLSSKILTHTFDDMQDVYDPLKLHLKIIFGEISREKRMNTNSSLKYEVQQKISLLIKIINFEASDEV